MQVRISPPLCISWQNMHSYTCFAGRLDQFEYQHVLSSQHKSDLEINSLADENKTKEVRHETSASLSKSPGKTLFTHCMVHPSCKPS